MKLTDPAIEEKARAMAIEELGGLLTTQDAILRLPNTIASLQSQYDAVGVQLQASLDAEHEKLERARAMIRETLSALPLLGEDVAAVRLLGRDAAALFSEEKQRVIRKASRAAGNVESTLRTLESLVEVPRRAEQIGEALETAGLEELLDMVDDVASLAKRIASVTELSATTGVVNGDEHAFLRERVAPALEVVRSFETVLISSVLENVLLVAQFDAPLLHRIAHALEGPAGTAFADKLASSVRSGIIGDALTTALGRDAYVKKREAIARALADRHNFSSFGLRSASFDNFVCNDLLDLLRSVDTGEFSTAAFLARVEMRMTELALYVDVRGLEVDLMQTVSDATHCALRDVFSALQPLGRSGLLTACRWLGCGSSEADTKEAADHGVAQTLEGYTSRLLALQAAATVSSGAFCTSGFLASHVARFSAEVDEQYDGAVTQLLDDLRASVGEEPTISSPARLASSAHLFAHFEAMVSTSSAAGYLPLSIAHSMCMIQAVGRYGAGLVEVAEALWSELGEYIVCACVTECFMMRGFLDQLMSRPVGPRQEVAASECDPVLFYWDSVSHVMDSVQATLFLQSKALVQLLPLFVLADCSVVIDSLFTFEWSQESDAVTTLCVTARDYLADFISWLLPNFHGTLRTALIEGIAAVCLKQLRDSVGTRKTRALLADPQHSISFLQQLLRDTNTLHELSVDVLRPAEASALHARVRLPHVILSGPEMRVVEDVTKYSSELRKQDVAVLLGARNDIDARAIISQINFTTVDPPVLGIEPVNVPYGLPLGGTVLQRGLVGGSAEIALPTSPPRIMPRAREEAHHHRRTSSLTNFLKR